MQGSGSLGFRDHLRFEDERLLIDGVACDELAKRFDTPLYVLSEDRVRRNYRAFRDALQAVYPNVLVCPAYKANCHPAICRVYETEGAGAEVVSSTELRLALDAHVDAEKIVYNGPLKKRAELELAISSGVGMVNADSLTEIGEMQEAAKKVGRKCNLGIRVNIGISPGTHPYLATSQREDKFGIWMGDAIDAYKEARTRPELNVVGIHCHVGSNINNPTIVREMAGEVFKLASQVQREVGVRSGKIDLGGGFGFPYEPTSKAMTLDGYASALLTDRATLLRELGTPTLLFEPGRAVVADAGILLTRVGVVKRQGAVAWAIVDAGMNTFLRPALYGAKHRVVLANRLSNEQVNYSVGGPCCESGDVLAKDAPLPPLQEEDLLAILDVGAYGFTMANNYNGQPRPAVILTREGHSELIRPRETYQDMVGQEIVPPHLTTQPQ